LVDIGCPVLRDATACPERPVAARLTVTRSGPDPADVVHQMSDQSGHFAIDLKPGTYALSAGSRDGSAVPAATPVMVTVTAGHYSKVAVHLDSGVR